MFNCKVLMCRPTYFAVEYSINRWMDLAGEPVDHERAMRQWTELHHTIIRLGGYVEYVEPTPEQPDMCFTANAALCHGGIAILSRFASGERRGEEPGFAAALEIKATQGTKTVGSLFEGAGDAFVVNGTLFLGSGYRTDPGAAIDVMSHIGVKSLVLCNLVDPHFYHLDTCFCPLDNRRIMIYPQAFDPASLAAIRRTGLSLLEVGEEEARRFACNAVVLRDEVSTHVILPTGCEDTFRRLEFLGYRPHRVDMSEFRKAGGACKIGRAHV